MVQYDPTGRIPVPTGSENDDDIIREAIERWKDIAEWQGTSDEKSREDIKFSHGDARNAWQWPDKIFAQRTSDGADLPTLTINKTRVHNDIVINEIAKGDFSVKIRPTGGKASAKSAEIMMALMRRIQNISKYSAQRRRVVEHQVDGGIGYIIIETRFKSARSRDQEIFLYAPRDATSVYLDRWIKEPDGSDAAFGFIFERMPRREFNRKHPRYAGKVGQSPLGSEFTGAWLTDTEIILAKYYRKIERPDTYVWYRTDDGEEVEKLASEIKAETRGDESKLAIFNALMEDIENGVIEGGTRKVFDDAVEWYLIAGDTIIERGDWAGRYIPICRAVGREVVVDNQLDRKGMTRALIDAQRMLNYAASCEVEGVGSAVKAQWMAPARAIENQPAWKDANVKNYAVLVYNDVDDVAADPQVQTIAPPQRIDQAKPSPGWLQVGQDAERHMMMASGQFQSQLGEGDQGQTAISGKAIGQRQAQADTATYHFTEHLSDMDRYIGIQLIDLIPKIYDTNRTMQVLDAKGELSWIEIDPDQDEALRELQNVREDQEAAKIALNPAVGEYECVSDPGPSYATQRQEAWDAMVMILSQRPELSGIVGDLFFRNGDFPGAEELAERMQREIKATKPYLLGDAPDPQTAALAQQVQQLTANNAELMNQLADEKLKWRGRDEQRDIDAFKAETERMRARIEMLEKLTLTPKQQAEQEHELAVAGHEHVFNVVEDTNRANLESERAANGAGE